MNIDFSKGIFTKVDVASTPLGFYRDAQCLVRQANTLVSDKGTEKVSGTDPIIVLGYCVIDSEIIIVGKSSGTILGAIRQDGTYYTIVEARQVDVLKVTEPVDVVGKKDWQGNRVIYFSTEEKARRIDLGPIGTTKSFSNSDATFDKTTSLFVDYEIPVAEYTRETTGGDLPTGVYQFFPRLSTDSGASTSFGVSSPVIPVVVANTNTSEVQTITGDEPQSDSNKAIEILVTNIDTTFKYLEVAVLTYVGFENTEVVTLTRKVEIAGRSEITLTYRGTIDNTSTISLEELISSGVSYTAGKYFEQKDNSLLIAGVRESEVPDVDWFKVAENIDVRYTVHKIPYGESLAFQKTGMDKPDTRNMNVSITINSPNYYGNPKTAAEKPGYRREEVYGFSLTPVYKSGVLGPTVHIPSTTDDPLATVNFGNLDEGGVPGTYISEERYPSDYPSQYANTGIRLHKFPTPIQQPIVEGNPVTNIRVLGVKFSNIKLSQEEVDRGEQDKIQGYIIGRLNRRGYETQLAQGIVRPVFKNRYGDQDSIQDFNKWPNYVSTFGDGYATYRLKKSSSRQVQVPVYDPGNYDDMVSFTFIAPDIIHRFHTPGEATHIAQHDMFVCDPYADGGTGDGFDALIKQDEGEDSREFTYPMGFFKNVTGSTSGVVNLDYSKITMDRSRIKLNSKFVNVSPFGVPWRGVDGGGKKNTVIQKGDETMYMASTDGFVWYGTESEVLPFYAPKLPMNDNARTGGIGASSNGVIYTNSEVAAENRSYYQMSQYSDESGGGPTGDGGGGSGPDKSVNYIADLSGNKAGFAVYSTVREDLKQYGSLSQFIYMGIGYTKYQNDTEIECFGGDTFINKYGLTINDEAIYMWETSEGDGKKIFPPGLSGIVYMWIESSNNYAYRNYIQPESFQTDNLSASNGSVPFFPAYTKLINSGEDASFGILSLSADNWVRPGYASRYNNQYSAQNSIKPYAETPLEDVSSDTTELLKNRIVYSSTAVEGEKLDSYQFFGVNNYYDVPRNFGDITDLYVNRELYASTAQVQWALFFNTLATQATNVGEVVLGTGGAFNRPASPLTNITGGYSGTSHFLHRVSTPYGDVFVDKLNGAIYHTTPEGVKEVSAILDIKDKNSWKFLLDSEIRLGLDIDNNRVLIRLGDYCLSYSYENSSIDSYYKITPDMMVSSGDSLYLTSKTNNPGIYKYGNGPAGLFLGNKLESSITVVINPDLYETLVFRVLNINSYIKGSQRYPNNTFTGLKVWGGSRNSGDIEILPKPSAFASPGDLQVFSDKVGDKFRVFIPRDRVINPSGDIMSENNLQQPPLKWLPRMSGNHILVQLKFDNLKGQIVLNKLDIDLSSKSI